MKQFLVSALCAYVAVSAGATVVEPARWCSTMVVGCCLFVFTPLVMSAAMLAVCLPLSVIVVAIGVLFAWGRPSGAGELVREILALPIAVVPGYVAALRRVRSPRVWGFVVGCVTATATLLISVTSTLQP